MKRLEKYSVLECKQLERVKNIGEIHGNSPELKEACKEAYELYRCGKISVECYGEIYSNAFDNYFNLEL